MQINEAIGVLDKYFGDLQLNPREVAWQCIRKELVEGQKPSPNKAMPKCLCDRCEIEPCPVGRGTRKTRCGHRAVFGTSA